MYTLKHGILCVLFRGILKMPHFIESSFKVSFLCKRPVWRCDIPWFIIGKFQVRLASWSLVSYLVWCAQCDLSCTLRICDMMQVSWYDMGQMMSYDMRIQGGDMFPSCCGWRLNHLGGETAFSGRGGWLVCSAPATRLPTETLPWAEGSGQG